MCSYPAIEEADCRVKARYLLAIEARGELDLEEHMQAVLRSMLRRGSAWLKSTDFSAPGTLSHRELSRPMVELALDVAIAAAQS